MRRTDEQGGRLRWLYDLCVGRIYATHNRSTSIRRAISICLQQLADGGLGLNVGAGRTRVHPRILNLDLTQTREVDVCGDAEALPFASGTFRVILTQEALEHIRNPKAALAEMHRVLHERGVLYCQVPFVIGYHPGPTDFERWTREGIDELLRSAGFQCQEIGISVGPATGCYRIAVEFWAVLFSCISSRLYLPVKGLVALLLSPMKLLDPLMARSVQADRIAGGYYVIGRKHVGTLGL